MKTANDVGAVKEVVGHIAQFLTSLDDKYSPELISIGLERVYKLQVLRCIIMVEGYTNEVE